MSNVRSARGEDDQSPKSLTEEEVEDEELSNASPKSAEGGPVSEEEVEDEELSQRSQDLEKPMSEEAVEDEVLSEQ